MTSSSMTTTSTGALWMPVCGPSAAGGTLLEAWLCETAILLVGTPTPVPSAGGEFKSGSCTIDFIYEVRRRFGIRLPASWKFIVLEQKILASPKPTKRCILQISASCINTIPTALDHIIIIRPRYQNIIR
jgi:hypothetical protein